MNPAIFAVICSILWGVGYTILKLTRVSAYVINFFYGLVLCICNLMAIFFTNGFVNNGINELAEAKQAVGLVGYIVIFTASSFVYMYGYTRSDVNSGVYVAVSGSYVVVSFLTSQWFMHMDWITFVVINYYRTVTGIVLITIGSVLLAL